MSELEHFLAQWRQPSPTITVTTSGSTGTPKTIHVYKERMRASARATCQALHLHEGQRALLCLSTRYIAGMMMVVRALECGMQLVEAPVSQHPLSTDVGEIHFAAMVPAQVWASLNVERERERLSHIGCLIIGGGSIDEALERKLSSFPNAIYSTYGMTETLSHVALRRVSGSDASPWYRPLPGVTISAGADNCLVIDAPHVCEGRLHTHDIVCFHPDGIRFQILGRSDNVICSGGVKIQTEEAERLLRPHISLPFMITKRPHPQWGEEVVLLVEQTAGLSKQIDDVTLLETCAGLLPLHWSPRAVVRVSRLPLTATGKPDRATAQKLAKD